MLEISLVLPGKSSCRAFYSLRIPHPTTQLGQRHTTPENEIFLHTHTHRKVNILYTICSSHRHTLHWNFFCFPPLS
uniref:Uncharacterized protein n=1 Tax=Anguilla anguilla TaxID=7936 RepID=A0A0E9P6U4_ANGAN